MITYNFLKEVLIFLFLLKTIGIFQKQYIVAFNAQKCLNANFFGHFLSKRTFHFQIK